MFSENKFFKLTEMGEKIEHVSKLSIRNGQTGFRFHLFYRQYEKKIPFNLEFNLFFMEAKNS